MIYTALGIMFWMRASPLLGQVGEDWALKFLSFLGPKNFSNPRAQSPPTCPCTGYARIQNIMHGLYKS
jgi:hypothetical protein